MEINDPNQSVKCKQKKKKKSLEIIDPKCKWTLTVIIKNLNFINDAHNEVMVKAKQV